MAEIFLSYANEDRETAGKVAALLESAGLTVWWDRRIPAGRTWRSVLEEALTEMRCMVVLWSSHSIDSHWVKEEAEEARALEKLIPVLIEPVNPPVGFRSIQAADLTHWDGSRQTEGSRQLIADLQSLLGEPLKKVQREAEPGRRKIEEEPESPADPSGDERRSEPASEQSQRPRGITNRSAVNWQAMSAGGAALAVLLVALWLWPKSEEPAAPEPATKIETEAPAAPSLMNLKISAPRNQLKSGETLVLRLESQYSDGTKKEIKEALRWASSNANVASVDDSGQVKALQAGTTTITASDGKIVADPWTLTVQAPQPRIPEAGLRPPHSAPQYPNPALPSPPSAEAVGQRIAPYLTRAKNYRAQGNYAAALAELEKARAIDPSRPEIRLEAEQTRKACNAEKSLGYNVNC